MGHLTILADIHVKPDHLDFMLDALNKLIKTSVEEKGCLKYAMHQDNNDPCHLFFYETWETRELWLQHMNTARMEAHKQKTAGVVESEVISEMTLIS